MHFYLFIGLKFVILFTSQSQLALRTLLLCLCECSVSSSLRPNTTSIDFGLLVAKECLSIYYISMFVTVKVMLYM